MPRVSAMLLPFLAMLAAAGAVDVLEGELPEDVPASCADGEECDLHLLQSAALKVTSEVDAESQDDEVHFVKSHGIGQRLERLLKKIVPKCSDADEFKQSQCIQKALNEKAGNKGKWGVFMGNFHRMGWSIQLPHTRC
ncbi:unnamed protein product [Symbiodinium sp. CCMP2592]|nr:unnamed protein product [Symbiodinium sp. CCMP2592]